MSVAISNILLEKLDKIITNTRREADFSFVLSSNTSDFTTDISPPLQLKSDRWVVGLIDFASYNSIYNITAANNIFTYSSNNGSTWNTLTLAPGAYEITDINTTVQMIMSLVTTTKIDILANSTTLGSVIIVPTNYKVDFTVGNSIAATLGFDPVVLSAGYNYSPHDVDILTVNSILVNCSIIKNSYVKNSQQPVIYSFFPNVRPGAKIIESPKNIVYLPISSDTISSIKIWLTDQAGNKVDFRGQEITIRLQIKSL